MLGHSSAAMTLDAYAGLFEDDVDAVLDRLHGARVHQVCTEARVVPLRPVFGDTAFPCGAGHSLWGSRGLNPGPTDYESAALTG